MNHLLLVTYDIANGSRKYEQLFTELQQAGPWWHFIKNTWLIQTDEGPRDFYQHLKPYMDSEINLLVVEVSAEHPPQGWLPRDAWEWIGEAVDLPEKDYA